MNPKPSIINNFGIAYLSKDLKIVKCDIYFQKLFYEDSTEENSSIYKLIEELKDFEEELLEVVEGEEKYYKILNVENTGEWEGLTSNIHIFYTGNPKAPILLLVQTFNVEESEFAEVNIVDENKKAEVEDRTFTLIHKGILGTSEPILNLKKMIDQIVDYEDLTVLISGESGTGKSLVAKVLHYASSKNDAPFITVNCASIPDNLLESELFGHSKGAFTGAVKDKRGLIEEAENGTLFLDEIGEMSLKLQAKLLTFLEERQYRRIGDTNDKKINVRIIAATNKDLSQLVKNEQFREDLYYRLNVVRLVVPSLREMKNDIHVIATNFMNIYNLKYKKDVTSFSEDAIVKMKKYDWPGNIRELRNVVERAIVFTPNDVITAEHIQLFPVKENMIPAVENNLSILNKLGISEEGLSLTEIERSILNEALEACNWNQSEAARLLQISREKLRYRIEKYNLK